MLSLAPRGLLDMNVMVIWAQVRMQVTTILPCPQPWRKLASLGHTDRAQQEMEKGQGPPLAHKPLIAACPPYAPSQTLHLLPRPSSGPSPH